MLSSPSSFPYLIQKTQKRSFHYKISLLLDTRSCVSGPTPGGPFYNIARWNELPHTLWFHVLFDLDLLRVISWPSRANCTPSGWNSGRYLVFQGHTTLQDNATALQKKKCVNGCPFLPWGLKPTGLEKHSLCGDLHSRTLAKAGNFCQSQHESTHSLHRSQAFLISVRINIYYEYTYYVFMYYVIYACAINSPLWKNHLYDPTTLNLLNV